MYLETEECIKLASVWSIPAYLPESELPPIQEARPINLWIYIPLGILVVVMFAWQLKLLKNEHLELAK